MNGMLLPLISNNPKERCTMIKVRLNSLQGDTLELTFGNATYRVTGCSGSTRVAYESASFAFDGVSSPVVLPGFAWGFIQREIGMDDLAHVLDSPEAYHVIKSLAQLCAERPAQEVLCLIPDVLEDSLAILSS